MKKTKLEENIDAAPEAIDETNPTPEGIDETIPAPEGKDDIYILVPLTEPIDETIPAPEMIDEESEDASENKADIEDDEVQISCFKCKEKMIFGTDHRPQKHICSCGAKYRVVYRKGQLSALLLK